MPLIPYAVLCACVACMHIVYTNVHTLGPHCVKNYNRLPAMHFSGIDN